MELDLQSKGTSPKFLIRLFGGWILVTTIRSQRERKEGKGGSIGDPYSEFLIMIGIVTNRNGIFMEGRNSVKMKTSLRMLVFMINH